MNNVDSIKSDGYKAGDAIRISSRQQGLKEGTIISFSETMIKLQPFEQGKKPFTISDANIEWYDDDVSHQFVETPVAVGGQTTASSEIKSTPASQEDTSNNSVEKDEYVPTESEKELASFGIKVVGHKQLDESDNNRLAQSDVPQKKENVNISSPKPSKKTQLFTDFSQLATLDFVRERHEKEDSSLVREMGKIVQYGYGGFGFIKDEKTSSRLWFSSYELLDIDNSKNLIGERVVYTKSSNLNGPIAICIHRPNTVKELLNLVDKLIDSGKRYDAIEVINHIYDIYPNCYSATMKLKEIQSKKVKYSTTQQKTPSNFYDQAKVFATNKQYKEAIECYQKAIDKRIRVDSAVKDMGMLLVQISKDSSVDFSSFPDPGVFMGQNVHLLEENNNKWSFLENFYYAIKDYEKFKHAAKKLLSKIDEKADRPRYVFLLNKLAAVLIREGNVDEARKQLDNAIRISPDSQGAAKLLTILNANNISTEEIESIISESQIEIFGGGLSIFISETLNKYEDYDGVPTKNKESKKFTKDNLKAVRKLIESFSEKELAGRAADRARYLLTEGKLIQQLEPDNKIQLRSVMARYCNDMAKIHIYDRSAPDVICFFYNEAFALESTFNATAPQVSLNLLANKGDYAQLIQVINRNIPVAEALEEVLKGDFDYEVWSNILNMFLYNSNITSNIISKFFENDNYKRLSIQALSQFGVQTDNFTNKNSYANAWNRAREIRINEYKQASAYFDSLVKSGSIEEITRSLYENISKVRKPWMCRLDKHRLSEIERNITPSLEMYHKASGYRNKEVNYNSAQRLIEKLSRDITSEPTKFSYEVILPALSYLNQMVDASFDNIKASSEPSPAISLLLSECFVGDSKFPLQLEVSLDKNSAPINNVCVTVQDNDNLTQIETGPDNPLLGLIEGGGTHIFQPTIQVTDEVIKQKAVSMTVNCSYKYGDIEKNISTPISLHLSESNSFERIQNPYAAVAESGPLPANSKMFYGHKDYIHDAVDAILQSSQSKQVLIYGQKRSGKSSVLNRVEAQLNEAGAFCVKFSMGKIVRSISEGTFYYKILSEIQSKLEDMREDGQLVPDFSLPTKTVFINEDQDNPVETFTAYLRSFKRACKKTAGWEDKRLVVLIDEFTYMYGAIRMGVIDPSIMQQWKAVTQDESALFSAVLVGQDVMPAFKNEPYARNAFGVSADLPLSYLEPQDAKALIEEPIFINGETRFVGSAVDLIMDYTACSPYYIQIFCTRLVNYMNEHMMPKVTEADVKHVAHDLVSGIYALDKAKFENLLSPRETDSDEDQAGIEVDEAIRAYKDDDVETVLRAIAKATDTKPYAHEDEITSGVSSQSGILKQLTSRGVIEQKDKNYYKIRVSLYKEWLLNN